MWTRRPRLSGTAVVLVALAASTVTVAAVAAEMVDSEVAFTVTDPAIVESSGLTWADVDGRRWVVTVNDSGDTGQVFTLDPETGETVGVTTFEPGPRDVEALAPAGDGHVWAGDIGDNPRSRETISLVRVAVGPGDRTAQGLVVRELRYPDRARDAETLLAHPRTGQLYVVTKSVVAGGVWQVPRDAGAGPATLEQVAEVPSLITDGAFLPSGDRVLLRSYTHAFLLSHPEWELLDSFVLPAQPQGEGLTVLPDREVLLSTEGRDRDVLRVTVPGVTRGGGADVRPSEAPQDPVDAWWQGVFDRWVALL